MKMYGSINNRFDEGHNYNEDHQIHVGDDITMYLWSDRHCYYVTKVIDQKHIFVKPYHVCADHDSAPMSNEWKYFKSHKEMNDYLRKYFPDQDFCDDEYDQEEEWMFRYNNWKRVIRVNYDKILEDIEERKQFDFEQDGYVRPDEEYIDSVIKRRTSTKTNYEKLKAGKEIAEYFELSGKVSFGVLDYYYDYEF